MFFSRICFIFLIFAYVGASNDVDDNSFENNVEDALKFGKVYGFNVRAGEKLYYISLYLSSWQTAFDFCKRSSMQLLSLETKEEQQLLEEAFKDAELTGFSYWTSLSDAGNEGVFTWRGSGAGVSHSAWRATAPDNAGKGEDCVVAHFDKDGTARWDDRDCAANNRYVCERPE